MYSKYIPLESIFCKEDFEKNDVIIDVIYCCYEWIKIFNIVSFLIYIILSLLFLPQDMVTFVG